VVYINVEEKEKNTKYEIIIGLLAVIFLFLLIIISMENNSSNDETVKRTTTTTTEKIIINTNKGVSSPINNPSGLNTLITTTLYDEESDKYTDIDLNLYAFLSDEEVTSLANENHYNLNDGFKLVGIEYQVTFNDLTYLTNPITPKLSIGLYDEIYQNDFFHVGEHYYKIDVLNISDDRVIGNNQSISLKAIYQVPIDQGYYICFGYKEHQNGCYKF